MWEKCSVRGRVTSVDKVGKKGTFCTIKSSRKEVHVMAISSILANMISLMILSDKCWRSYCSSWLSCKNKYR